MNKEKGESFPTLAEIFWESFGFWCSADLGTVAAGGTFGLIFGLLSAGPLGILVIPIGITIAVLYATFFHSQIAILTWAFWLTRYRIVAAGISGGLAGIISVATLCPIPSSNLIGSRGIWIALAGLLGATGSVWAGYRFTRSIYSRNITARIPRSTQWQFSLRDLFIHFTVLAVLISVWASVIAVLP